MKFKGFCIFLKLGPPCFVVYCRRVKRLKDKGWYRNLVGGMVDRHCMRIISPLELVRMTDQEFVSLR